MIGLPHWVLPAIAAASIPPLVILSRRVLRPRRIASLGRPLELAFQAEDNLSNRTMIQAPIFQSGEDRRFKNVLEGAIPFGRMLVFDYEHRAKAAPPMPGKKPRRPRKENMTVVAYRIPGWSIRHFELAEGELRAGSLPGSAAARLAGLGRGIHAQSAGEWVVVFKRNGRLGTRGFTEFLRCTRSFTKAVIGAGDLESAA